MPKLIYFADPMCSWCWGFAPVIQRVQAELPYRVEVVMGGLRAGETRAMTAELREYVQHHWHQVGETTGQPFQFEGALPDGFVYDTEPACRAVVAMRTLQGEAAALAYLHDLQQAFYAGARDIKREEVLAELATRHAVSADGFSHYWHSNETRMATLADFERKEKCGVMGFPCLIADTGERLRMITMGYQSFEIVTQQLERRLGKITAH